MYQLHWVLVLLWTFENLIHSVSKSQVFFKETPWPFCTSVLLQRTDPKLENWARYRSGKAVREITNPRDPTEYWTTYKTEHTLPVTDGSPQLAGGRPTQWHQHNILTGSVNNQCVSQRFSPRHISQVLVHRDAELMTDPGQDYFSGYMNYSNLRLWWSACLKGASLWPLQNNE